MKKKKKKFICIIAILTIIFLLLMIYTLFLKKDKKVEETKVIEEIESFSYVLHDNDTEYYKTIFSDLKKCLNEKEVNKEEYASIVAKLFISDFFTLDNKTSKNDVGGIQFIYNDYQEDFKKYAKDSIYKSVKSNVYGDREQNLPIVSEVIIDNIGSTSYTISEISYDAYQVNVTIKYESDLGYPTSKELIIISKEDVLEIVKLDN